MKGKLIVFYGVNNLGKTTQAKLLEKWLNGIGINAEYKKYGIYDLEPSGPELDDYLRLGNHDNLSPREFQLVHIINRTQFEPKLKSKLNEGTWIIAEDYVGTGTAWGVGAGVDQAFLERMNSHLLKEDLAFLFDGERFSSGIEKVHKHEQDNELTQRVRKVHQELAQKHGWIKINANASIEEIHATIKNIILNKLKL